MLVLVGSLEAMCVLNTALTTWVLQVAQAQLVCMPPNG
jgi:hypothetical protein